MRWFFAIALLCAVTHASAELRYLPNPKFTETLAPKADPSLVEMLDARSLRAQVRIGQLAIRGGPGISREELVRQARSKAAELGADFIYAAGERDITTRSGAPPGPSSGGLQSRGSRNIVSSAPVLWFEVGVFAKATLGIEYMNPLITRGRPVVNAFRPASKAAAAGMEAGDEILEIDGIGMIDDDERYIRWILASAPDQVASVRVRRGDSTLVVQVPLVAND